MDGRLVRFARAITLMELLIAMILLSLIALGFYSVDVFSRRQVLTSDRQAVVQNEVSIVLAHMTKQIARAIGSTALAGQNPISFTAISGNTTLRVYVDGGDGKWGTTGDKWIAYRYRPGSAVASARYQIWYYPDYSASPGTYEVIGRKISAFSRSTTENRVSISVSACWDPAGSCGTPQNPQVTMEATAKMPSVSTN